MFPVKDNTNPIDHDLVSYVYELTSDLPFLIWQGIDVALRSIGFEKRPDLFSNLTFAASPI